MGAYKEKWAEAVEVVSEWLTDSNAHYARTILDFSISGECGSHLEAELLLAYRVGVDVLYELSRARQDGNAPDFAAAVNGLQDYSATIGATPKGGN